MTTLPSAAHAIVNPSPPSCTVAVHALLLTSQNLHVPSLLTDASSASLVGFQATLSIPPVCPLSSVLFFTCGFSGFHIRSVRSADPVAMRWPVGFQAMVRMLMRASELSESVSGRGKKGRWTCVRVGAWASGGGVVIGLDFEGWEEGGEAVFGYGTTRMWWGHWEGARRGNWRVMPSLFV